MHSGAHMYIVKILIVIIVLLMSMQVFTGAFDTEAETERNDVIGTCASKVDDLEVVIHESIKSIRIAMAFVPRHGPSFGIGAKIGVGFGISFKVGWSRPCDGPIEVENLSVAVHMGRQGDRLN